MAQKIQRRVYCDCCQKPVMGVRQTQSRGGLLVAMTSGLSLAAGHFWYCPDCGERVQHQTTKDMKEDEVKPGR